MNFILLINIAYNQLLERELKTFSKRFDEEVLKELEKNEKFSKTVH